MNFREGMSRLARVTALAYWLVALGSLAIDFPNQLILAKNARIPDELIQTFNVELADGAVFDVDARSEKMMEEIVNPVVKHPKDERASRLLAGSYLKGALRVERRAPLIEAARRKLLNVDEETRKAILAREPAEAWAVWGAATIETLKHLAWLIGAYVGLLLAFRAIRWVALGFMSTAPKQ